MFSEEDFGRHKCDMSLAGVKIIPVAYFRDDSYGNKKLMTGWGVDGILYTFEVTPRHAIPVVMCPADDSYHEPANRRKVTRTIINKTYVPRFSHEK